MPDTLDHSADLMRNYFDRFYSNENTCDVTLLVGGKKFPVHRLVLAAHSDFFRVLFYENQMMEANQQQMTLEASPDAFEQILKYVYSGKFNLNHEIDALLNILELSHRYALTKLEEGLIEHLAGIVNLENLLVILKAGEMFNSEKLIRKCVDTLNWNYKEFVATENFLKLTENEIVWIFSQLVATSLQKIEGISEWLKVHPECSTDVHAELLGCVDLRLLTNQQLTRIVRPTKLVDDSELLDILVSRNDDVKQEHEPIYYTPIPAIKIIIGDGSGETSKISAVKKNIRWEIVIDLGEFLTFNHLQMNIGGKRCSTLSVEICSIPEYPKDADAGDIPWYEIKRYYYCRALQTIYLPETITRFLRIRGAETINNFKLAKLSVLPELEDFWTCPSENICTMQTAILEDDDSVELTSQAALSWDRVERGIDTPFTESDTILIKLNQPYFLRQFKFRVWDFDGRKQSFTVKSAVVNGGYNKVKVEFQNVAGWQVIDLEPMAYRAFHLCGGDSPIRFVHFEATA